MGSNEPSRKLISKKLINIPTRGSVSPKLCYKGGGSQGELGKSATAFSSWCDGRSSKQEGV